MGNFCSPRKSEQLKTELLVEAKLSPSFEDSLSSKLFSNHAAKIINEFEKFMYLQAIKASGSSAHEFKPLLASPIIDQVWRHAINYTKYYIDHSEKLVGRFGLSYIHRIDPRTMKPREAYDAYKETLRLYDAYIGINFRKGDPRSLPALLWPEYATEDDMQLDLRYYVWIDDDKKAQLKKAVIESFQKDSKKSIDPKELATSLATEAPSKKLTENTLVNIPEKGDPHIDPSRLEGLQLKYMQVVNEIKFPPEFLEVLSSEQMISTSLAQQWISEYKKYLLMSYVLNGAATPSREVDEVWHLHQNFTENYTASGKLIFGFYMHHTPAAHDGSEKEDYIEIYNRTLDLYASLFGNEAPKHIWPDATVRFGPANRNWVNLNRFIEAVVMLEKLK